MEQLSINTIKIDLCSLTYQKVPKTSCENYIHILIQKNRNEKYLVYYQYKYKNKSKYKITPPLSHTFITTQSRKKIKRNDTKFQSKPLQ